MATELHWNGIYGSAIHDGKYSLFKDRPSGLTFSFDAFSYAKDGYAKRRWQGKSIDLTDPQKEECRLLAMQIADKVLPDPTPPWNPDAIVAFEPNDEEGSVTVYHADGRSRHKDLRVMIDNTPEIPIPPTERP